MAIIERDLNLTPEVLAPALSSEVFDEHENARFWIGVVATPELVSMPEEYTAARRLRANVYIEKYHFLEPSARQVDGGETDVDDARSAQLAVVENRLDDEKLVGTARLIQKTNIDEKLPVEMFFPEAFVDADASVGSLEASRFIAQHTDRMTQHTISLSLMRAMAARGHAQGAEYIYAVIESHLARLFEGVGMPFEEIAPEKPIPEYHNTLNMAVRFDPKEIFDVVQRDIKKKEIISTFFEDALVSLGVGHYDETLITPID